ncbi:hypothetical protein [Jeotgalibaca porci]|uniref:hypothetical protein n=1 Tax=Jeotgalibaca porci TaxID=1868793 RepID=UPI0035A1309C
MTDNIKPDHYRKGEIDLYEAWYRTYPFNEYRAIMQAVAERYMRRDKNDRVEDLDKAVETLKRLKEKEIEHAESYREVETKDGIIIYKNNSDEIQYKDIYMLNLLLENGYRYLARDEDDELWAYDIRPTKRENAWDYDTGCEVFEVKSYFFPEVQWSDAEPTRIVDLLATYENGGENGK